MSDRNTVIIDFNDSFTYNIFEQLRKVGAEDFSIIPASELQNLLDGNKFKLPGRLILSPGPGVPGDYPAVRKLLDILFAAGVPVLGICLGHQLLYTYCGGSLKNLESVVHGQPRRIRLLAGDPVFSGIPEKFTAGLYHSWAAADPVPKTLQLLAASEDGTIMAVRHIHHAAWGVQFHPESFITEYGAQLLSNFLSL